MDSSAPAGNLEAGHDLDLHHPGVLSDLTVYHAPSGGGATWHGTVTFQVENGLRVDGIAIGELLPAVQGVGKAAGTVTTPFDGIVIAAEPGGILAGGVGVGSWNLDLEGTIGDPFTGEFHIRAP